MLQVLGDLLRGHPQAARVGGAQRLAAAYDGHRFHALVAQHRAAAVLACHVAVVAVDGGKAHLVLTRHPAGVDAELVAGEIEHPFEGLLRFPRVLAHEDGGVPQLDGVVVYIKVDPLRRPALQHDGVVARILQVGAEETVRLGVGGAVGEGAAGDNRESARTPGRQTGQRTRSQHQTVILVIPADLRRNLVPQNLCAQANPADAGCGTLGLSRVRSQWALPSDQPEYLGRRKPPGSSCLHMLSLLHAQSLRVPTW